MDKKQIKILVTFKILALTIIVYAFDQISCNGQILDTAQPTDIKVELQPTEQPTQQQIMVPTAQDTAHPVEVPHE